MLVGSYENYRSALDFVCLESLQARREHSSLKFAKIGQYLKLKWILHANLNNVELSFKPIQFVNHVKKQYISFYNTIKVY